MPVRTDPEPERPPHPFALTVLYLPYGMAGGYVMVTLGYLLAHAGVSVESVATIVALSILPQTWKVLWAPVLDTTLSARSWYLLSTVVTGLTLLALALVPAEQHSLWLLDVLVLISGVACSFSAMATEMLMAHHTPENQKGRAGGWSQAGNLGGAGLGGGVALWLSQHAAAWTGGATLAGLSLLCSFALRYYKQPERGAHAPGLHYGHALLAVGRDVWSIARGRAGYLTLLLFILPISTGAASNLWSAVADEWHASADTVAFINGIMGGLICMVGSVAGGYMCDAIDRKGCYALFGVVQGLLAVAMALSAKTPLTFVIYTCAYAVLSGCIWAAFSAAALETIGRRSAATNYNLLACFSNTPITYVTLIEGHVHTRWGSDGMLYTEAVLCALAAVVFSIAVLATRPRVLPSVSPA